MADKKILLLCTGNSCRSQMAEGFAQYSGWRAFSAGTHPESAVNPFAVKVMAEIGIDISGHIPQSVNDFIREDFHVVATVCDNANEACPVFIGKCNHRIHHGFTDPAEAVGSDEEITEVYRQSRDEIQDWLNEIKMNYL